MGLPESWMGEPSVLVLSALTRLALVPQVLLDVAQMKITGYVLQSERPQLPFSEAARP